MTETRRTTPALGAVLAALVWVACSTDDPEPPSGGDSSPAIGAGGMVATAGGGGTGIAGTGAGGAPAVPAEQPAAGSGGRAAQPVAGAGPAGAGGAGGSSADAGASGAGDAGASGSGGAASGAGGAAGGGAAGAGGSGGQSGAGEGGEPPVTDRCVGQGRMVLNETIVVESGDTFDGQCRRYVAGAALGDGSQSENQQPVFRLEDGARLVNVVLGSPAADGIHTYGDVTLANIVWEDIGEDALTIKESGTVELDGGSAVDGDDKVFQINAPSTFRVSNFRADSAGKFIRQDGGTDFEVIVYIDRCDISNMDEAIFRTDSPISSVTMTNTRYHNIGDSLFIGVAAARITQQNNTEY